MTTSNLTSTTLDLTLELCSEDGSNTQFYQSDENSIHKIMGLLNTPRLFSQPSLTLASERSVSIVPCRTLDLILVRTPAALPLPLPPGWLDIVEVGAVAFQEEVLLKLARNGQEDVPAPEADDGATYLEIHTAGNWMIILSLLAARPATIQDQRQRLAHFFDLPVIPFRLPAGGAGFLNPAKISRLTLYPSFPGTGESVLPADFLRCVRP
jgi:hypothetical protein